MSVKKPRKPQDTDGLIMFIEQEAALAKHALRHGRLAETEQRLGFIADTIAEMRNKEIE